MIWRHRIQSLVHEAAKPNLQFFQSRETCVLSCWSQSVFFANYVVSWEFFSNLIRRILFEPPKAFAITLVAKGVVLNFFGLKFMLGYLVSGWFFGFRYISMNPCCDHALWFIVAESLSELVCFRGELSWHALADLFAFQIFPQYLYHQYQLVRVGLGIFHPVLL